jgi:hypothetical protein
MTIREFAVQRQDGTLLRAKSAAEFRILGSGLYRLGAPLKSLTRYADTLKQAKIGLVRRKRLEQAAKSVAANPYEWFSCAEAFPMAKACAVERYDGNKWVAFNRENAGKQVLQEQQDTIPLVQALMATGRADAIPRKFEMLF